MHGLASLQCIIITTQAPSALAYEYQEWKHTQRPGQGVSNLRSSSNSSHLHLLHFASHVHVLKAFPFIHQRRPVPGFKLVLSLDTCRATDKDKIPLLTPP